jgi:hypothetical protein
MTPMNAKERKTLQKIVQIWAKGSNLLQKEAFFQSDYTKKLYEKASKLAKI